MITFHKLGELGRLGNQLFQYAALKSLGLKNGYDVVIPNPQTMNWHGQTCLLDQFNIEAGYLDDDNISQIQYMYSEPNWNKYDPTFFEIPDGSTIEGFFQSTFYFEEFEEQIKKELTPKSELVECNKQFIDKIKSENEGYEIVSVHVRRGDNMTNGQTGLIQAFEPGGIYEQYFNNAKKIFEGKKVKFLVFTGGQRFNEDNSTDVEWCKNFFKGDEFLFSEGQPQIDDFCRIMLCDHNILSQASSFGWWAAYVNPNPNKIVVAPEYYHPDEPGLKRDKFYPKEFIQV
jgi:hypothetical protein